MKWPVIDCNDLLFSTGAWVEERGRQDPHVYRSTWLAHCVSQSGEIQENQQEHHDQYDGHPGRGHKEAGRRKRRTTNTRGIPALEISQKLRYDWGAYSAIHTSVIFDQFNSSSTHDIPTFHSRKSTGAADCIHDGSIKSQYGFFWAARATPWFSNRKAAIFDVISCTCVLPATPLVFIKCMIFTGECKCSGWVFFFLL